MVATRISENVQSNTSSGSDKTLTFAATAFTAGDIVTIEALANNGGATGTFATLLTPTGGTGVTWTLVRPVQNGDATSGSSAGAWWALIPSDQTATFAQTTNRHQVGDALSTRGVMRRWQNVDTVTPIRQSVGYGSAATDPLITNTNLRLTTMKAGDAACASGVDWSAQATVTTQFDSGLSRTESINANEAGQAHFIAYWQSSTLAADDADVRAEMDASAATGNWAAVMYALAAAATAPTSGFQTSYGQQKPTHPQLPSRVSKGITIGTAPATPPPVATKDYGYPVLQPVQKSYYNQLATPPVVTTTVPPVAETVYAKPLIPVVPPSYIELGLSDQDVETVPVPSVEYSKPTAQPVPPSYQFVSLDASTVETVPVPTVRYSKNVTQPVPPSTFATNFDASVAETVPVPVTAYGKFPPYIPPPSNAKLGFNPSDVETVPVPIVLTGKSLVQPVPIGYILLGLPDQQVETVPVPVTAKGAALAQPALPSFILEGVVPPVANTGGQFIPVLTGVALAPVVQPSKLYQGITIGTAPVSVFTAYTLYSNVISVKAPPSFAVQALQPDVTARVLYGQTVATPLQPSTLMRGLYHPDVETVPVLRALVSTPPQGVVVPSKALTGAYPQQPITFSTRLYAKARDQRERYPSWIQLALQQGLAPDVQKPGLVVIEFDGDTVLISYALTYVDITFGADTIDISLANTFVDVTIGADTVEVYLRV
jgi:hypothetical protein